MSFLSCFRICFKVAPEQRAELRQQYEAATKKVNPLAAEDDGFEDWEAKQAPTANAGSGGSQKELESLSLSPKVALGLGTAPSTATPALTPKVGSSKPTTKPPAPTAAKPVPKAETPPPEPEPDYFAEMEPKKIQVTFVKPKEVITSPPTATSAFLPIPAQPSSRLRLEDDSWANTGKSIDEWASSENVEDSIAAPAPSPAAAPGAVPKEKPGKKIEVTRGVPVDFKFDDE